MKKKLVVSLIIGLLVILSGFSIFSISAQTSLNVLVVGEDIDDYLMDRILLDPSFLITSRSTVGSDISGFDCIVILDYIPTTAEINQLVLFPGGIAIFVYSNLASNATLLETLGLASVSSGILYQNNSLPVPTESSLEHPIIENIQWNTVPTVTNYTNIQLTGTILLETSSDSPHPDLALVSTNNNDKHIVFNFFPDRVFNNELIDWPFFNYLFYLTIMSIDGQTVQTYAKWDYSPVPHTMETVVLGVSVLITVIITVVGYVYSRKYAKKNPIKEEDLQKMSKEVKESEEWEEVGMHRQLGGFLVQLFAGLLILLPNVVMTALVFPLIILPSPQAAGFYDFTIRFFEALWLFFDFGTSIVLVKFFSEHRIKRPQHAIKYVQMFVWFQMLSGIAQLFLISFIGSIVFPHTFLAHMSWLFVTHAFFQWPAFFLVFMYLFQAMNRIDIYQFLNLLLYAVFNITVQYLVIVLFRFTLGKNPVFGDGLAGAIGYSVGFYVIQVLSFFIGLLFFKRLGFSLKSIFRIDFTWVEIKEAFKFGFKWTLGAILPPLGWFIQLFLLSKFLPNYTQQQGYFSIAWN
ncbi:MAG: hypothetical protein KAS63_11475, partial [Candidatus Heimdallarchaeota archaeon]|nr:hypothetical protein [Candidatus Heimdallarchaeota archaeon]MCK4955978.1 hypothetical protein [Candidatus Heimdallarchaeota archaeon]